MNVRLSVKNLSSFEKGLWLFSLCAAFAGFLLSGFSNPLVLAATLIGATALIFTAKGDVLGQILMIIFALLYAVISYGFRYFGEMITYLGMTAPIALLAVITWRKNPYSKEQVKVGSMTAKKAGILLICTMAVTWIFYRILALLGTNNMLFSTISIATSFLAASLTVLRSPGYAMAYAANDIVLIVLWIMATAEDPGFLPVVICFTMFLVNDIYGFVSWRRMKKLQQSSGAA